MPGWTPDQLSRIGEAQELRIAPVRVNGELRRETTIWGVRADDGINDAEHRATTLRLVPGGDA